MKENEEQEQEPPVTESELAPTPRTDAEAWSDLQDRQWIDAEVSRQLERELAAARVAIKVAREILAKAKKDSEHAFSPSAILEAFSAALAQLNTHTHE